MVLNREPRRVSNKGDGEEWREASLPKTELFPLGSIFMTSGVEASIPVSEVLAAIRRHHQGDWGELCPEDQTANQAALVNESRLLSVYKSSQGQKFYIITEWDRSSTTVLLPDEY